MTFFPSPDPRKLFARDVEAMVRQRPRLTDVRYDHDRFTILFKTETGDHAISLAAVFAETSEMSPAMRNERLLHFVQASGETDLDTSWAVAAPRLVPLLRASSVESAILPSTTGGRAPNLARRPFLPFLHACLAIDNPRSTSYVRNDILEEWSISLDAASGRAIENLVRRDESHSVEPFDAAAGYPNWNVTANDGYEASRLLLPGWLAGFAGNVHGRPIAIVPERSQLIIAGDGDDKAIDRLLTAADREFTASPRRLSPGVYTVDKTGRVVPYFPPPGHPLATRAKLAHMKLAFHEYSQQQPALEERVAAEGTRVHVAAYQVVDTDAIGPVSFVVWTKGVDWLLPVADLVALGRDDGAPPRLVPWAAITSYAWAHLKPYGTEPQRMMTQGWPDEAILRQLEAYTVRYQTG